MKDSVFALCQELKQPSDNMLTVAYGVLHHISKPGRQLISRDTLALWQAPLFVSAVPKYGRGHISSCGQDLGTIAHRFLKGLTTGSGTVERRVPAEIA